MTPNASRRSEPFGWRDTGNIVRVFGRVHYGSKRQTYSSRSVYASEPLGQRQRPPFAIVAQLDGKRPCKENDAGSSPAGGSKFLSAMCRKGEVTVSAITATITIPICQAQLMVRQPTKRATSSCPFLTEGAFLLDTK